MAKSICCRDVGMDCDFEATAETLEALFEKCAAHAATDHGMTEIPPEVAAKLQGAIRDV